MQPLTIVVAVAKNGVIGKGGAMPWPRIPEDMRYFRRLTEGHAVIMGRRTFESIGKPLLLRRNIVVTSNGLLSETACIETSASFEGALALARVTDPNPHVIGGASVYAAALPLATRIYWTEVNRDGIEGDVYFPAFDRAAWRETYRRPANDDATVEFTTLERQK